MEKSLASLGTSASNLNTMSKSNNARLGAILKAQNELVTAQTDILAAQEGLFTAQEGLSTAQGQINAQINFLLTQSASANQWNITNSPGIGYVEQTPSTTTGTVWLAFNSAYDASLTVTTSSTGAVSVTIAGNVGAEATATSFAESFIGLEIMRNGSVFRAPGPGDGPYVLMQGGFLRLTTAGCPYLTDVSSPLLPNTPYVFRTRRGYEFTAGGGGDGYAEWTGCTITVTKLGM